jgi:CRP-like cAMP-binding protein
VKEVANVDWEKIIDIVKRLEFFKDFSLQEQKKVVDFRTHLYVYEKDEYLIKDGSEDTSFFILLKGSVDVFKKTKEHPLASLSAGNSFGEIAFLTGSKRTANVIAKETVIVLKVDRSMFDRLDNNLKDKFKDNFIKKLIERLNQMNNAFVNRWI